MPFAVLGLHALIKGFRVAQSAMQHANTKALDQSGRDVGEARRKLQLRPTARNHICLAQTLLDHKQYDEAATCFEDCLLGPFCNDPQLRWQAAHARLAQGQVAAALEHLQKLCAAAPDFRAEDTALLMVQARAATGDAVATRAEFENALQRFGSFEIRAEYAIWCYSQDTDADQQTARRLDGELHRLMKRWHPRARTWHLCAVKRLQLARQTPGKLPTATTV